MKQHITVKQLGEIEIRNMDAFAIFKNEGYLYWLIGRYLLPLTMEDINDIDFQLGEMAISIDIRTMIEALYEYDDVEIQSSGKQWYVGVAGHIETQAIELVDALWEAVKIVLEK